MPFIPVPQTVKVSWIQTLNGQQVINVHHFKTAADYQIDDIVSLAEAARDTLVFGLAPCLNHVWFANGVEAVDLAAQDGERYFAPCQADTHGELLSLALPGNVAAVVTKNTDLRGRSYRGRTYIAGMDVNNMTASGTFSSGFVADILDVIAELFTLDTTIPWLLSVVSYWLNKVHRVEGVATPVESISMDTVPDSQRRRLPGRGA